jgi:hypothetical protein
VQTLAGEFVDRHCTFQGGLFAVNQSTEALQGRATERQISSIYMTFCTTNLCNGSGSLADIFTMTILLPACLVVISFFSRQ